MSVGRVVSSTVTMTRDDAPPSASAGIFENASAEVGRSTAIAHLDTSEVRWFAPGRPPADVIEWFSDGGSAGTTERRFDIYHLNSRSDVGTKRRSRRSVEVKVLGQYFGRACSSPECLETTA